MCYGNVLQCGVVLIILCQKVKLFLLLLFVRPQKDKYEEEDMGHVMSDISGYYNIRLVGGFCVGNLNDSLGGH